MLATLVAAGALAPPGTCLIRATTYYTANVSISTKEVLTTIAEDPFPFSQTFWPTEVVRILQALRRDASSHVLTIYDVLLDIDTLQLHRFITVSPSIPSPPSTLDQEDCAVAYYGANLKSMPLEGNGASAFAHSRLLGACGLPLDSDLGCLVQGGPVQLYYFPVTTKGGLCDSNGTTVTNEEKQAPITTLGTTFQPGSVYLSFSTLYAAYRRFTAPGGPAVQVGPTFSNTIFAFQSEEVSTICYVSSWGDMSATSGAQEPGHGPGTQLNYADLDSPVPASAYQCQNQCKPSSTYIGSDGEFSSTAIHPNPCYTIYDNFNPLLSTPTRLRDMVPEWSSCDFWNYQQANIVFDPPTALRQVSLAAQPTLPTSHASTTKSAPMASTARSSMVENAAPASAASSGADVGRVVHLSSLVIMAVVVTVARHMLI